MQTIFRRRLGAATFGASWLAIAAAGTSHTAFADAPALAMHRAPQAPSHAALAAPTLVGGANRLQRTYGGTPIDVTTYHYDTYRTGWNQTETDLTPASVASSNFGLLSTLTVDGNVLAQPLLVSGFVMPDGSTHDVLIIATGHDSVYAFDAQTYATLWQVSLGTSQNSNDIGCGDVVPEYGISSTPVIVRGAANKATIYLVAGTEPSSHVFQTYLHALDLGTGADSTPPVSISPTGKLSNGSTLSFDPRNQWSRTGLAYDNGSLYVGIGSHCDNNSGSISGWMLRYNSKLKLNQAFHTVYSAGGTELASIWMTGFAPAFDPSGNLFVVTGNGDFTKGKKDWGESVLKLPSTLKKVTDYFTADSYAHLNQEDTDFGSGGVMLIPAVSGQTAPPMAVAMGKASVLYLLNQDNLGKLQKNDAGALQWQSGGGGGLWGGPAYYNGPSGPTVYTQGNGDVVRAWSVAETGTPALTPQVDGTSVAGYGGSIPIVSSNGASANTGVLWLIDRRNEPFTIEAYDAVKLRAPIFSATIGNWSNSGNGNPFLTAMQANGRVYAPGYKLVRVFGLTP